MKLAEILLETSKSLLFKTPHAHISYGWKKDLLDKEDEDYLPDGYNPNKVLELKLITVNKKEDLYKGYGTDIMKKFLETPIAKKAELIFLDINSNTGFINWPSKEYIKNKTKILDDLEKFYKKFGFRNKHKHARMWLVQKGKIPDNELPT
jgi:hypothetical protein